MINSIAPNFNGRSRENINAFINLDDDAIRQIAAAKTERSIDIEKNKRRSRMMDLALPLAGGLSAAAYADKGTRLSSFVKGTGSWALFLAGAGAVFGAEKFVRSKSEKINNFAQNHPLLTFVTSFATSVAAGVLAVRGGKAAYGALKNTGIYKNVAAKAGELAGKVKANKYVAQASELANQALHKTPTIVKDLAKVVASWTPIMLVFGSLSHSLKTQSKVNDTYSKNYMALKEKQINLARRMNNELAVQNDFLMTDSNNRKDVETLF